MVSDNLIKENITPERKLVYLVKAITKYQSAHNSNKLFEIAQSMYNESKDESFSPLMKKAYKKQSIRILQVKLDIIHNMYFFFFFKK